MDLKMEIYSPGLELLGLLETWKSVVWDEYAFKSGTFSIEALIADDTVSLLKAENIVWIEGDTAGIIECINEKVGDDGPYIAAKGKLLTGLLSRRILWGRYNFYDTPPKIMYSLVDDCAINPTRGDAEARRIPGLALSGPAPGGGEKIRKQKTGDELIETLSDIGETNKVAFGIRFNAQIPRMEFWARYGMDRSVHQTANEPVFYSTELDDVLEAEYLYNSADWKNVALVAGEDTDDGRVYLTVNGDGGAESGDLPVTPDPGPQDPEPPGPVTPPATQYTVSVSVSGTGTATGGGAYEEGSTVTLTASAADGYTFAGWREDGAIISTDPTLTFTATGDRNITAVFEAIPVYTISATVDPDGSGTVTGTGTYRAGETVTLTAAVADGYEFSGWSEGGAIVSTDEVYTFTASGDRALIAVFGVPKETHNLPAGFTELEYVEVSSQKVAYLSTGLSRQNSAMDTITMDAYLPAYTGTAGTNYGHLWGYPAITSGSTSYYKHIQQYNAGKLSYRIGTGTISARTAAFENKRCIIEFFTGNKLRYKIDENEYTLSSFSVVSTSAVLYLFGRSSSEYARVGKYYSFKVTDAGGVVRLHFIPARNDSNGKVGFYDIARNAFYAPATGTLDAGPAV